MDHTLASSLAGYLSILCWLIVFTPQLLENYKRKSGDGLSMTFLVIWLAGDVFNLLGVIMQDLLVTMFVLALYYTVADMALIWQVIYYQRQQKPIEEEVFPGESSVLIGPSSLPTYDTTTISSATNKKTSQAKKTRLFNWTSAIAIVLVTVISCYTYYNAHWKHNHHNDDDTNRLNWLPQTMGWTSAALYVGSRIPQILKNYKHKSTEGLSFGMFICAVLGNVLFTSSIFLKSTEKSYILMNLSWIIGSTGTLIFDFIIFLQFFVYEKEIEK
ncbi:PQ loop repeat-domain-containing protein [Mucor mucedo]|uniref:PQ loop repeat-domain-containing protein n=1 Tax=Mucor mucedo TaxID=29922 RepID=UPI0022211EA5|nr:PQ loop repeat-domain-containing protein [Mucor mucedo]KAI7896006.1 PQ loop repeat-domain-containing protein [Mucor mucedo]